MVVCEAECKFSRQPNQSRAPRPKMTYHQHVHRLVSVWSALANVQASNSICIQSGYEVGACNVNMHVNVAQHGLAATVVDGGTERTFKSVIIEQQRQICLGTRRET